LKVVQLIRRFYKKSKIKA